MAHSRTPGPIEHVVVMVQENHTTDNYLRSAAAYGANIATGWPTATNPPASDQPHDRATWVRWLARKITGAHVQFDTAAVMPFYAWLAASGALLENHCSGFGTNSTPNHLLIVGGQTPTLKNPSRKGPQPVWDMPSLPGHAGDHGISWRAYTGTSGYPVEFYRQLQGSPNIVRSDQLAADAAAGTLPALSMLWHDSPSDEHPAADVTIGHNAVWQTVSAIVAAGLWDSTVFLLTWDDWGGYDDHVVPPHIESDLSGHQLAYGSRLPLLMFGGRVRPGIDHRWCGHTSITKTVLQLLGLPPLGVPRVDDDPGLADLVEQRPDARVPLMPAPPAFGTTIVQPPPPQPRPTPTPPPPPPVATPTTVGPVLLRDGTTLPPPDDVVIK
ncbi:alkaline phosphatase family protein [Nocardia sp. CDC153]|uniref:alkaline phosphatase family protein n=1 Tax=Nocardia sp. CDC153 TaxID=3112167 RepID=UPI002DBC43B7|nr:alkaline phosphatase family protein [Nocardia sp. CDC153]MEC3957025.1 alkaline phosphatase family protein [Nocardia sp. CDC153]